MVGNRVEKGMKTGNLGADKKKMKQIFFSSIDSFVHGFAFNGPFSLANFIQGIFKNQASNCKIQGIHTFS